jgi:DnaJ-class molecular chaperone
MSKTHLVIDIKPEYEGENERLDAGVFTCPQCNGSGHVSAPDNPYRDFDTCTVCDGKGKIKATVIVEWDKINDNGK